MAPRQTDDQLPGVSHHPARKGDQGEAHCLETLAHPLSAQHQPLHRRAQVEGQHRYGPPCGVGSEQPRREPARSQVTLQDAVDLLAFTASLPVPPDHLISRKVSVGHQPGDLVPGSAGQPHHGEGQFQLQFHSRQRLFAQRLPDSDEPVFRVLLAVGYPVLVRSSPPPTVDLSRPRWRPVCGAGHASLVRQPRTPRA